ncbi:MAG: hypothetical protein SPL86_06350 [Succiniclasticum sp.]|uniref:hypothetical protein n=1 Tax=Succiniclasticum sp. TaxID=2775030 RepID=UPI002A90BE8E|nr:hypothetical protein [Succiniclasticum sp.]MDY6291086.1 hypothetical protein [Succiniclasticum sp.]
MFDYLLKTPVPKCSCKLENQIVFAGNLAKSDFLKDKAMQDLNVEFVLYGPGFDKNLIKWRNINYSGSFSPDEVPYKLRGSFGLIWDGDSISTSQGRTGELLHSLV